MSIFAKIDRRILLIAERTIMRGVYRCGYVDSVLDRARRAGYVTVELVPIEKTIKKARKAFVRGKFPDRLFHTVFIIHLTEAGWARAPKWNTLATLDGHV